jgi:hypothetical protein
MPRPHPSLDRDGERFVLLHEKRDEQLNRNFPAIFPRMNLSCRNKEDLASMNRGGRLAVPEKRQVSFRDISEKVSRMRMSRFSRAGR